MVPGPSCCISALERMRACRTAGVRSIWELPDKLRPMPVVVIVDEIAELHLSDGRRESKAEAEQCSTPLLRLAQLGAALGMYLGQTPVSLTINGFLTWVLSGFSHF